MQQYIYTFCSFFAGDIAGVNLHIGVPLDGICWFLELLNHIFHINGAAERSGQRC